MHRAAAATPGPLRDLVLVGGGHAHVQVLRRFAMTPLPPGTRVTLIVDTPVAVYSGMVPGCVAGRYREDELEIDTVPLARAARARVVVARATGVDARTRRVLLAGRPPLPYDVASFDIGATVAGLGLPGVREHALATRPIGRFVAAVGERLAEAARSGRPVLRVVVVGGGAGGVELAFCLERRLAAAAIAPRVTLVHGGERLLEGFPSALAGRLMRRAAARGIDVRLRAQVVAVSATVARLAGGEEIGHDLLLWVSGAEGFSLFRDSGLPVDARGFVRIAETLEVEAPEAAGSLFAAGDCAVLSAHPWVPRAGVYAVRQGPYLADNLGAALAGRPLRRYRPQRGFLTLLNLGDGSAAGAKAGVSFAGRWVMRLKDRIDRAFMRKFQLLDREGQPLAASGLAAGAMTTGAETPMTCGGCAAKLGEEELDRALARLDPPPAAPEVVLGLGQGDDAAAVRTPGGDVAVVTVDAFRAFTDDPYLVGRVAALNAASDLLAKGVAPRHALALVTVPDAEADDGGRGEETLFQVLAGMRAALDPLGVALVGGHTTIGPELHVGLSMTGYADPGLPLLAGDRLVPGQALVLTKALGTGVVLHADLQGRCPGRWREATLAAMLRDNAAASRVARQVGATAATDVTGFGLAVHLARMLRASRVSATLDVARLPALPGALSFLGRGLRSTAQARNERCRRGLDLSQPALGDPRLPLLFDPQTAGGLLLAVPAGRAGEALALLHRQGDADAAAIARVEVERPDGARLRVEAGLPPEWP